MSRVCELLSTRPVYGNKVSHSNIKTRTRWNPNLKSKKYMIPELNRTLTLLLSTRAIRTVDKLGGLTKALFETPEAKLSERLLKVKNQILKKRREA